MSVAPPDDTGAETQARFHYQTCVVGGLCIAMCASKEIAAVIPEFHEDAALELADGTWRFIQIKSKDPELGPWTLKQILASGLPSLRRTFGALGADSEYTLELHLEGALRRGDPITKLYERDVTIELVQTVAADLSLDEATCRAFLKRVRVHTQPSRGVIEAQLRDAIGTGQPRASFTDLNATAERLLARVERAERAQGGTDWPFSVMRADALPPDVRAARRIARDVAHAIIGPALPTGHYLFTRSAEPPLAATQLEMKMRDGGASDVVIDDAKHLRARAAERESELQAASVFDSPLLEDLRERLRLLANAWAEAERGSPFPANRIWATAQRDLNANAGAIDQSRLFHSDPFLLLGEICQLSDECVVGWGNA